MMTSSDAPTDPPPAAPGTGIDHPDGTAVLVMGVLSLLACGLLGPVAWKMGNAALRSVAAHPEVTYRNVGNIRAGRLCGVIATGLIIAIAVIGVVGLVVWLLMVRDIRNGL